MLDDREIKRLLLHVAARDEGSAEAFERLYKACAPLLLGIAQRIVNRREVAEEVLHDGLSTIWKSAESFDPMGMQPVAWMAAIVRNRAIDVISNANVSRVESFHAGAEENPDGLLDRLFEWSADPGEAEDSRRAAAWLRDCLKELKAVERQSLVLAYDRGMSHGDLAAHLQQPLGTVKTWVRRGMENLRACIESCMGGAR